MWKEKIITHFGILSQCFRGEDAEHHGDVVGIANLEAEERTRNLRNTKLYTSSSLCTNSVSPLGAGGSFCDYLYDALSISGYITSNDKMIDE
jgi:hypothetical protein